MKEQPSIHLLFWTGNSIAPGLKIRTELSVDCLDELLTLILDNREGNATATEETHKTP